MASGKKQVTMTNIPDDILSTNIFIRLPAKQIAQMRSLSKPWNAFLSSPAFIKFHLDHSARNNDEILLVFTDSYCFKDVKLITTRPTQSPNVQLIDFVKNLIVKPLCEDGQCNIIGSVNGLICFTYTFYSYPTMFIWNPSLSALLHLPPHNGHSSCFRFGFDPRTDDYKVVNIKPPCTPLPGCSTPNANCWNRVQVYSMKKHCWGLFKSFSCLCTDIIHPDEVCVDGHDGHLHWLAYANKREFILAFDLGAETFDDISFPESIQDHQGNRINGLGFMSGKLCVMSQVIDNECEVWVMDQYWVAESWVKHRVFSHHCGIQKPFGFTLNNEFLFKDNDECVALYDPIASKVNSSKIKVMRHRYGSNIHVGTKIVQYVESLVWVAPAKQCIRKKPCRPKKGFRTWFT